MVNEFNALVEAVSKGSYEVKESFKSYRNKVYKLEVSIGKYTLPAVLKYHTVKINAAHEAALLSYLATRKIQVPQCCELDDGIIVLEYLPGQTVNRLVQELDCGEWIEKLAEWLSALHLIKKQEGCLLKGDVNLKNFIYCNNKIYGLDFEEEKYGDYMDDISDICFFILTNTPSLVKEKSIIVRRFLKAYQLYSRHSLSGIGKYILKSRQKAKLRRKIYRVYNTN